MNLLLADLTTGKIKNGHFLESDILCHWHFRYAAGKFLAHRKFRQVLIKMQILYNDIYFCLRTNWEILYAFVSMCI